MTYNRNRRREYELTITDAIRRDGLPVQRIIRQAIRHGERVMATCATDDGRLRNPKLYLQGSRHMLDALKTAAAVSTAINEAEKVRRFHQSIMTRVRTRDPEMAAAIIADLRELAEEWGLGAR